MNVGVSEIFENEGGTFGASKKNKFPKEGI
jgi:hypothetical protein